MKINGTGLRRLDWVLPCYRLATVCHQVRFNHLQEAIAAAESLEISPASEEMMGIIRFVIANGLSETVDCKALVSIHRELKKIGVLKEKVCAGDQSALQDLKRLANGNENIRAEANFTLGLIYNGNLNQAQEEIDQSLARRHYKLAADLKHGMAQFFLGNMLDYGDGGGQDYEAARAMYQGAADQGLEMPKCIWPGCRRPVVVALEISI